MIYFANSIVCSNFEYRKGIFSNLNKTLKKFQTKIDASSNLVSFQKTSYPIKLAHIDAPINFQTKYFFNLQHVSHVLFFIH